MEKDIHKDPVVTLPKQTPTPRYATRKNFVVAWNQLCKTMGSGTHTIIARAYSSPRRTYHNLDHIDMCLRILDTTEFKIEDAHARAALEVAIWFHDVVHDPLARHNKVHSAMLARDRMRRAGASTQYIDLVERLILATAHTSTAGFNFDQKLAEVILEEIICDVDMAIFGVAEDDYSDYERKIRSEYSVVPEEEYRAGRREFLEGVYANGIFHTNVMCYTYGHRATENVIARIRELKRQASV